MRPTGRRGRGAAQPHSRVPSWESLGSWFPREPWVKPRGSKPRLPRARGCQARVWGLPAGVARRGNQTRAVATQQNPLVQPSVRSTNPCRGPVGAGVGRGVEEGRRAGGSGRERCPRPAGDLSRRDPGGRRALGCGRGGEACALPPGCRPRGQGRLCSRLATGRPEQARVFCPRLWRRLTHAAPEKGVVEGGRVLCVEPEATSRRRRSRESGVAEAAARVRGLAPGCGREKRGVGCRGGGLHARRRPSTSP